MNCMFVKQRERHEHKNSNCQSLNPDLLAINSSHNRFNLFMSVSLAVNTASLLNVFIAFYTLCDDTPNSTWQILCFLRITVAHKHNAEESGGQENDLSHRQSKMCLSCELPYCFLNCEENVSVEHCKWLWAHRHRCKKRILCTLSLTHAVFI